MAKMRSLNLAGQFAAVHVLTDVEKFAIDEPAFVVNPTVCDVSVDAPGASVVPGLSSRALRSVTLEYADLLVLVRPPQPSSVGRVRTAPGWRHHSEIGNGARPSGGSRLPLWRSPQVEIGTVTIAPAQLPGQRGAVHTPWRFGVRLSMWFAASGTDCGIHNQHDFIEIHTQVSGSGRMQKFLRNTESSLYEEELMTPGYTTCVPYCAVTSAGAFEYPWHRYLSDTDCLWLALEYRPEREDSPGSSELRAQN